MKSFPTECSNGEGFRYLTIPTGSLTLPSVLFGQCSEALRNITFSVDLGNVTDLYNNGYVWLILPDRDTSLLMTGNEDRFDI